MRTLIITSALALTLISPSLASAHVLETSDSIGVVMHINPDDAPLAGVPSRIYLTFSDKAGTFSLSGCNCSMYVAPYTDRASIEQSVPRALMAHSGSDTVATSYEFPELGMYAILVKGDPLDRGAFEPFAVLFDVRVAAYADEADSARPGILTGHVLHLLIVIGGAVIFVGMVLWDRYKKTLSSDL